MKSSLAEPIKHQLIFRCDFRDAAEVDRPLRRAMIKRTPKAFGVILSSFAATIIASPDGADDP
ncbi:MAG TPA: hypothetical protein VJ719_05005, partial [Chthoniobacterales bacterium]|nr:hypothetical protein [Chthoniobacterales bacterium]